VKGGEERAMQLAGQAMSVMLLILSALTLVFLAFMPWIIFGIAPGFEVGTERYEMAVAMSQITFPYLLFMSLTALLGGVLNAHDRFAPFAFAPILFNLSLIVALLLGGYFENAGYAMSWGVVIAGVLQFAYLWISAKRAKLRIRFERPVLSDDLKDIFRRMGPGLIGAGVLQINLFADLFIASFMQEGSISYLYYADRLNQLPLGMIGIAVGTALLPMLTRAMSSGNIDEARHLFNRALEVCLLLGLPAACGLLVVPHILVSVLFQHGAFTAADASTTAYVLMGYAIGLPAYIGVKVLSSVFWSRGDTKTPVKIAVITMTSNIVLSLILVQFLGVAGITLATGLTGWLQYVLLKQKMTDDIPYDPRLRNVFPKIVLSVGIMGIFLVLFSYFLTDYVAQQAGILSQIILLIVMMVGAGAVYSGAILGFNVVKPSDLKQYFRRKKI
jgi:putative peptidoglycan lipid II flippase